MNYNENDFAFGIDWLHGVLPFNDVTALWSALGSIDSRLGPDYWKPLGTFRNYNTRFICQGKPSITIAFNQDYLADPYSNKWYYSKNPSETPISLLAEDHPYNPGIFVSISGDGLRFINDKPGALKQILKYFRLQKFSCSRIDFYCDFFNPKNKIIPHVIKSFNNAVLEKPGGFCLRSNMRRTSGSSGTVDVHSYVDTIRPGGKKVTNVTFGNHGSSFGMFRCYDKWFEISSGRLNLYKEEMLKRCDDQYWYRIEYELHNGNTVRRAESIFNNLADDLMNVRECFGWCVNQMFDIVKIKYSQQKIDRREVSEIWDTFRQIIHFVQSGELPLVSVPWVEKTPEQFVRWLHRMQLAVYKIERLFANDPELKVKILSAGEERYNSDIVQKQLFDNFFDKLIC